MKRRIYMMLALVLLVTTLAACGSAGGGKQSPEPQNSPTESAAQGDGKVVQGIINKIDSYLVLLTDDGEYHIMDYGEGVTMDGFAEGDKVDVTYTGELDVDGATPVITSIVKSK